MKRKIAIKQLLHWQLARAKGAATPAPSARRLLEAARPWWETQPEQFKAWAERLGRIQIASGDAKAKPKASSAGHLVPVLIVHRAKTVETSGRIIYLNVRDGRIRLRLNMDTVILNSLQGIEVTFVDSQLRPLLSAAATSLRNQEYHLDIELPEPLAREWERLKAKDRMPFRLIVHSSKAEA